MCISMYTLHLHIIKYKKYLKYYFYINIKIQKPIQTHSATYYLTSSLSELQEPEQRLNKQEMIFHGNSF